MKIIVPPSAPTWMFEAFRLIEQWFRGPPSPFALKSYAAADLPPAADWPNCVVVVPDEAGGSVLAFSDGSDWRRVTDRAVVS